MSTDPIVKLNVGGTVFQTKKSTLTKLDGYFKTHFESDDFDYDDSDRIFIDRSPKHFDLILNFLREGYTPIPTDQLNLEEVAIEARFYGLTSLQAYVREQHIDKTIGDVYDELTEFKTQFGNYLNPWICSDALKGRIIKSDNQLLQYTTCPSSDTLILYYPVTDFGVFHPKEFNVFTFIEEHKSRFSIYFKTFPSDETDKWSWSIHCKDYCEKGSFHGKQGPFLVQLGRTMKKFEKYKKDNKYY